MTLILTSSTGTEGSMSNVTSITTGGAADLGAEPGSITVPG
jgi:hypothetical protein